MELFFFDIETCGEHKDYDTFLDTDERGAKLFAGKFEKMNWSDKYSDINEAYLENAGIISTYGKIVCISFGFIDNEGVSKISSYYGDNEEEIVNSFNNLLKKIETKNFNLSGFRILHFDLPWILHKLHKYGIEPANMIYLYDKKPWDLRVVDMSDDWKGKFAWAFSFDEMCSYNDEMRECIPSVSPNLVAFINSIISSNSSASYTYTCKSGPKISLSKYFL